MGDGGYRGHERGRWQTKGKTSSLSSVLCVMTDVVIIGSRKEQIVSFMAAELCCQSQISLDAMAMAIMMTEEHFHLLLRTVAAQTRSAGEERGGGGLRKVSANAFSRLTMFAKGEEDGKDWNFDFADILGLGCPELLQNLTVIEPMSEEMTPKVRELDVDKADNIGRTLVGNPRSCLLFQTAF